MAFPVREHEKFPGYAKNRMPTPNAKRKKKGYGKMNAMLMIPHIVQDFVSVYGFERGYTLFQREVHPPRVVVAQDRRV